MKFEHNRKYCATKKFDVQIIPGIAFAINVGDTMKVARATVADGDDIVFFFSDKYHKMFCLTRTKAETILADAKAFDLPALHDEEIAELLKTCDAHDCENCSLRHIYQCDSRLYKEVAKRLGSSAKKPIDLRKDAKDEH